MRQSPVCLNGFRFDHLQPAGWPWIGGRENVKPLSLLGMSLALGAAVGGQQALAQMPPPGSAPHYFSVPNYANSPLPVVVGTTVTGGIRKFVDGLPGLGAAGANNLGQYIPLAVAGHHDVSGHRLLRDRGRPVLGEDALRPAADEAPRLRAARDPSLRGQLGAPREHRREPHPAARRVAGRGRRGAALPRSAHRRDEGPPGPDPLPQPPPDRRCREPLHPRRHHRHGLGDGT